MGRSSDPGYPEPMSDGNASFLRAARAGNVEKVLEYLKGSIDINISNANGLNALHLSSKEGHVNVVIELVKRGANVNAATKKGNTGLHIASLAGQEEVVKILIRNGANVNVQSQNGFTPLYMAAQENHDNVVKFLLANGANQSLATEDGFTPLAVALQQGHDKVVAVLLENDAKGRVRLPALHIAAKKDDCKAAALLLQNDHDPDVTSKSGFTPLHIAAHYGNENIGTLLLEKNADVNYSAKHQITPLHVAAKWGKSNMVTLLVSKNAKIDASTRDGLTPLHCAARSGHDQVVDLLLEQGAPITAKTKNGLAPLHMASQGDHVDSARILLYHKAPVDDVTVDYLTALHVAAHCGHVRVAKLLLDRKADPNARALNGFTPLHIACKKNRIKVVELLLKHGASIEATTESGLTPLHVASFMGCMNIVIYLIQHGANPDVPTVRGETPLHLAARANQSDIIRILLRNGAHVDASAREQQTPLHIAARLGNVDIVGLLLQHGAAVDATTKDMYTALHIAAKEGQEEVASVLLDHGASLTATTKKGFTPLHLAAKYGNIKVARLLLQKDAPVDSQGKNGVTPLHVAAHYDHVNVALLLLDKGAYPHATAKNGYTPLHIAAKKNQMDIATTLLEYGAKPNAESKAGFTPLHLAAQEGHTDMTTLLIEHHADPNSPAKNLLMPLHLCAQEDRVNVAAILVKNGADIGPQTKAGYTPLHVACHFGQINMIRFLLQHGADVNAITSHGYTPLHQAAQQGHTLIINLLLEHKASPNTTTSLGQTALSIAQRLGYVSVVETLKIVTETVVTTTTTTVTEEKYKVVAPETMQETFMSDSEDEGGDDIEDTTLYGKPAHATHVYLPYIEGQRLLTTEDTMLGDQSFRYLTADEMKSLGDDSLPIDVTRDEKAMDSTLSAPLTAEEDHLTPQHIVYDEGFSTSMTVDNVELARAPVHAGFLVSFMVDARGGAMRGCRHSGVRVIIPPRKAPMPMRITCRYLRKEKLAHPPPLMEGEACASRILEVGPAGAKFLGPVIIEVPHFAALRGREREITILRSDNGESWREHTLEASDDAVHDVFSESFEGEELTALEDLNTNRITRILTTDFPQYFAIITRIRQEVHAIGPEGGMVSSTVVPQVQAIFPEGALTKKIKVGLQAQPITPELVTKMLGNRVAVSPIVTVEPRRRKFHKPITLTIPVPQAATKGMINQYSGDAPTLRLLCSITGGTTKAQWEDVTGSTPLTFVNDCVSFTTTVSARFWLMDCRQVTEATKFATELYREAIHVPFMAKFVVFSKRHDPLEAQLRVFCMTDDKEDKTLESQEHFSEVAKSRDVEVLEAKYQYLEFAGNLVPVTKSGEQLSLTFQAFRENRLPFTIRVKDPHQEPLGRVAFMREPRVGRGEPPQTPICNLNIALPEAQLTPVSELVTLEKKYGFVEETGLANPELIHRADLRLSDIAKELRDDWVPLALQLDVPETDINSIRSECPDNANQQALVMLRHWLQRAGSKATGNSLEKALRKINRDDIVNQCMFNVELVTDDVEKAVAKVHLDQSGFDTFKEELGSSRDASLRRDASLNGTLDDRDIMKEAESAAETSSESSDKEGHFRAELQEQQPVQETESEEQEVKEEVFIQEAVRTPEATLVVSELSPNKPAQELSSDSFTPAMSNGLILETSLQEEEKSEPTTATISSEATAELEISSTDERPERETHTERKEWTETDASGGVTQITQIKTETSIKVGSGDSQTDHKLDPSEGVSIGDEQVLSFVEKRNFFQRLSLTSETSPLTSKWTQEVSLDDIPMAEGEIVKEQISFEDRLKMFEPDEDNVRRKIQQNGKKEEQTVYRYDFTKEEKDKLPATDFIASELEKAEQIVKQVTDELTAEEHGLSGDTSATKKEVDSPSFTLDAVEKEVSTLLAEVNREEKLCMEGSTPVQDSSSTEIRADSYHTSEKYVQETTEKESPEYAQLEVDVERPTSAADDKSIDGMSRSTKSESDIENAIFIQECPSSRQDSIDQRSDYMVEEVEEDQRLSNLEAFVTPEPHEELAEPFRSELEGVSLQQTGTDSLSESVVKKDVGMTAEDLAHVGSKDYGRESYREALELEDDKSHLRGNYAPSKPPKDLDIQNVDISAVVKSQILDEELEQSIEDSPLEVKHIVEDIEKRDNGDYQGDVYKHIKTEIFSQQVSEDIESGSPERKDISPVTEVKSLEIMDVPVTLPMKESSVSEFAMKTSDDSTSQQECERAITSPIAEAIECFSSEEGKKSLPSLVTEYSEQEILEKHEIIEHTKHEDLEEMATPSAAELSEHEDSEECERSATPLTSEHIEHDDLEEYEEAKDEHSLSEQLLALASNAPQSVKCIGEEDFPSFHATDDLMRSNFDPYISKRSTRVDIDICRRSKNGGFTRPDKKEIRSLKTTKQVSTIEEHSSIESNDSPLELMHPEFSDDQCKTSEGDIDKSSSSASHVELESQVKSHDSEKVLETSTASDKIELLASTEATVTSCIPSLSTDDSSSQQAVASDEACSVTKVTATKDSIPKLPSTEDKSPKDSKKSDSDSEGKKPPGTSELHAPCKKDESFSSSGEIESHYFSADTSDSGKSTHSTPAGSRPCSSEFEINVLSAQGSEYETCATSQDTTGEISGSYATAATSQETSYSTACSSLSHSSRESAYSVDSESSGNLASVEVSSEASETLVPSAQEMELEFGADLEMPVLDEEPSPTELREPYDMDIPESVIRSGIELPFMKSWDISSEQQTQPTHWGWQYATQHEQHELSDTFEELKVHDYSGDVTPHAEDSSAVEFSSTPVEDACKESAFESLPSCYTAQAMDDHTESKISSESKCVKEDEAKAHSVFLQETRGMKHLAGLSQDVDDALEQTTCVDEEQHSVSESSATHSEHTWQTSSVDTAVQLSGRVSSTCLVPEALNAASFTDSLTDIPPEIGSSLEQMNIQTEQQPSSYLQLNGPVEVEFNPEYDTFEGDDSETPENYISGLQSDDLQFELDEVQNLGNQDIISEGSNSQHGIIGTMGVIESSGNTGGIQSSSGIQQNLDRSTGESHCTHTLAEAEQPESQQEHLLNYREYDEHIRPEAVGFQYHTSHLPESEQCSLQSQAQSSERLPHEFSRPLFGDEGTSHVKTSVSDTVDNSCKLESLSSIQRSDSTDKADIVDTSPEDERYDYQQQKCPQAAVSSRASENDVGINADLDLKSSSVLPSFQNVPGSELYTHEEEEMELKESDMFPSSFPDDDNRSTPSFEALHIRRYFPRSGETSAASSLQEFEKLEAEIAAGRGSQGSGDSFEKSIRTGEAVDGVHRFPQHSGQSSVASSLQEFERLEAEIAAGRCSRASADSYDKAVTSKSSEHDDVSMCSLTEFERLEKECDGTEQQGKTGSDSILSEIDEGPESQTSEAHIHQDAVRHDDDSDDSDYDRRMTEIEEIIKIAETNVEKFHEETVEDLSEGVTLEEFTVTHTTEPSESSVHIKGSELAVSHETAVEGKVEKVKTEEEAVVEFSTADTICGGGHDSSSNSSKNGKGDCMVSSTDSVDPSSSTATHATYQFETDSVMSSSINSAQASGEECTMVSSTDTLEPETKITYSQGDLAADDNFDSHGGIVLDSNIVQMSCHEYSPEDWKNGLKSHDSQHMEMFLTNLTEDSQEQTSVSTSLLQSGMSSYVDPNELCGPSLQETESMRMPSGILLPDEGGSGEDDDLLSRTTTTTTTRIITTVTTGGEDGTTEETQGTDELRSSMEAVLSQFMSEDTPSQEQSSKPE